LVEVHADQVTVGDLAGVGANTACRVGRLAIGGLTTGDGTGCHACSLAMVGWRVVLGRPALAFEYRSAPWSGARHLMETTTGIRTEFPSRPPIFLIMQYPVRPREEARCRRNVQRCRSGRESRGISTPSPPSTTTT